MTKSIEQAVKAKYVCSPRDSVHGQLLDLLTL